jgi:hypothetical protein
VSKLNVVRSHPDIQVKICPPLQLENLLPYEIMFKILNDDVNPQKRVPAVGTAKKGDITSIYMADVNATLGLNISVPETGLLTLFLKNSLSYRISFSQE